MRLRKILRESGKQKAAEGRGKEWADRKEKGRT